MGPGNRCCHAGSDAYQSWTDITSRRRFPTGAVGYAGGYLQPGAQGPPTETGFGVGFVSVAGLHPGLRLANSAESLYQDLRPEDLLAAVAPDCWPLHDRVFLYGSSLGGHAALYYANWFGARALPCAAAAGPSLLPALADRRLPAPGAADRLVHRELPEVADPALSPVVLFDPWTAADAAVCRSICPPAYPAAWFVPVRGAGHRVAQPAGLSAPAEADP